MENEETNSDELMMIHSSEALQSITAAEVDVQVRTAKAFPRDVAKSISNAITMVSMSKEVAASMNYTLPGRGDDDKPITGFSIRLAEIMKSNWKNISVATRIIGNDGRFVTAQAVCIDWENNIKEASEVKMSIVGKKGVYSLNMQQVVMMAAQSKAKRNAILAVIPGSLTKLVADAAYKIVAGTIAELPTNRKNAFDFFKGEYGIGAERILRRLGKKTIEEVDTDDIVTLQGIRNALRDEVMTINEAFPLAEEEDKPSEQPAGQEALKDMANKAAKDGWGTYMYEVSEPVTLNTVQQIEINLVKGDKLMPGTEEGVLMIDGIYTALEKDVLDKLAFFKKKKMPK